MKTFVIAASENFIGGLGWLTLNSITTDLVLANLQVVLHKILELVDNTTTACSLAVLGSCKHNRTWKITGALG